MGIRRSRSAYGKANYQNIYINRLDAEAEWLRAAAVQRADNIHFLLTKHSITAESILDLGCGTGAVITELQRRNIGKRYHGVDYSPEVIAYLTAHSSGIQTQVADLTDDSVSIPGAFDLAVVIHVLQHLDNPDQFLKNVRNVDFRFLIVEVPLEDLPLNRVMSCIGMHDKNPTGTLQFFNRKSAKELLTRNGFRVIEERVSAPMFDLETLKVLKMRYRWTTGQYLKKMLTSVMLPRLLGPIKHSLHYAYFSLLCEREVGSVTGGLSKKMKPLREIAV